MCHLQSRKKSGHLYIKFITMAKIVSFRHPSGLRHDERIAALIGNHGPAGYGVYLMIIEMLYRTESMRMEYSDKMIKRMAALTGLKYSDFDRLFNDMISLYDLFVVEGSNLTYRQGYFCSAITYRKPKKPRQVATALPENKGTGSTTLQPHPDASSTGNESPKAVGKTQSPQPFKEQRERNDDPVSPVASHNYQQQVVQFSDA